MLQSPDQTVVAVPSPTILITELHHQDSLQIVQSHRPVLHQNCSSYHKKMVMPEVSEAESNETASSMEVEQSGDETGRRVNSPPPPTLLIPDPHHVDPPQTPAEAETLIQLASRCFALAVNFLDHREHAALQCLLTLAWIKIQARQRTEQRGEQHREEPPV